MEIISDKKQTFGDYAYLAIAKNHRKFEKYETGVLQDQDPEDLHQMRVSMRKLRSTMTGFSLALNLPKNSGQKQVGKIARILGELRDLDVLLDTLNNQYKPNLPSLEKEQLNEVLITLKQRRIKIFKKVKYTLKSEFYCDLKTSLKQWLENPSYSKIANINIQDILPDLLLPQISRILLHEGWFVAINLPKDEQQINENLTAENVELLLNNQGKSLHNLRKEAKKTRYQMELFTDFYGKDYQNYLNEIKEIQTILGDIQDSVVLTDILKNILEDKLEKIMPVFNQILRDTRYQKWQDWRQLQIKFLGNNYRQNLHNVILRIKN